MRFRTAVAAALATLALAAPAQADDASLWNAYRTTLAAEREAAQLELADAYDALEDGATRAEVKRVMAANKRIVELQTPLIEAVAAQEPSTEGGAKAKALTIKGRRLYIRVQNAEIRGDELWLAGERKKAKRYYKKSERLAKSMNRLSRQEERAWKAIGYEFGEKS
jgi:hypothetical protein